MNGKEGSLMPVVLEAERTQCGEVMIEIVIAPTRGATDVFGGLSLPISWIAVLLSIWAACQASVLFFFFFICNSKLLLHSRFSIALVAKVLAATGTGDLNHKLALSLKEHEKRRYPDKWKVAAISGYFVNLVKRNLCFS